MTRIFLLTQGQQSLTRELTTPSLPTFVTTCLNIVTARASAQDARKLDIHNPLLDTVLQMLITLLPQHPSSFRPFINQIKLLLAPLLAPAPSSPAQNGHSSEITSFPSSSSVALAQHLYALLVYCAPKNTSSEEWTRAVRLILYQIHRTTDHIFRAVIEDWTSSNRIQSHVDTRVYGQLVSDYCDDDLHLPRWKGIYSGSERIVGLIQLLQAHISAASNSSVTIPIGSIWSLLERILSVIAPFKTSRNDHEIQPRLNPEIGRDEREGLWLSLPKIHISAMELMSLLIQRVGLSSIAFVQSSMERLLWVFRSSASQDDVRRSIYETVCQIVQLFGPSTSLSVARSMASLFQACCDDILPSIKLPNRVLQQSTNGAKKPASNGTSSYDADSYLRAAGTEASIPITLTELQRAAKALLLVLLIKLPSGFISKPLRSQIDRTAVLTNDKELMQASVLNPPTRQSKEMEMSILPLFARAYPDSLEVEAILRPRMPVLQRNRNQKGELESDEDEGILIRDDLRSAVAGGSQPEDPLRDSGKSFPDQKTMNQPYRLAQAVVGDMQGSKDTATVPASSVAENNRASQSPIRDPGKRAREPASLGEVTSASNLDSAEAPVVESTTPVAKRARLDEEVNVLAVAGESDAQAGAPVSGTDGVFVSSGRNTVATSELPVTSTRSTGATEGASDDSDDSFEIPPLDPSLDTDVEYDEEEVETI